MKKNNISRFFAALLMGFAMFMVSCEPIENGNDVEPDFPELVKKTVQAGESVSLTFDANLDWEVSVPASGIQWFWIQDGSFKTDKCSGKAGDKITVTIGVSPTEEFANTRSCEVTLTMGGKSKVIAELERLPKDMKLTVYTANVVDGEIQFVEDGSAYDYNAFEAESIDLIWTGSDFRLPIKVDANYSWTVKTPEWAVVDVPEDAESTAYVNVYGVPSKYPEEAASGKIQFMAGETVVKEYGITIPGCKDKFSYTLSGQTELDFSFKGLLKTAMGYVEGPAEATVTGTSDVRVFAVEKVDGKFVVESQEGPSWLVIDLEDYDTSSGADVLQTRNVAISVLNNEGDDREAVLFFLPPVGPDSVKDLFNETLDAVDDEFAQNAVSVIQHSSNQEYISMLTNASEMAAGGAVFQKSQDQDLYTRFGETKYAYELLYTNPYARDNARMVFTAPATSYEVRDASGNVVEEETDVDDDKKFFLSVALDEGLTGGVIDMDAEVRTTGYVVFYGDDDNVLAVVRCVFDPETVIGEVSDVAFIGESVMYAPIVGATLEHLTEGALYSQFREGDALVYHLTYKMAGFPMRISIPNTVVSHTVNPYMSKSYIRVNNNIYDEVFVNGKLGAIELIDGGVDIYMEMPEGDDFLRGNIIFADSEGTSVLILICTLDLTGGEE